MEPGEVQTGAQDVRQSVRDAAVWLAGTGVPEPQVSAEVLMAELLGTGRAEVLFDRRLLTEEQRALYKTWISRRKQREPVQRILGRAYFRRLALELNEETLVPRPDTESVVEAALEVIDRRTEFRCKVLDVGTGSGAIAISIAQERPYCEVHATDFSTRALEAARHNAAAAGVEVFLHRADLFSGLEVLEEKFSVLVSNPPYIRNADLLRLAPEVRDWDPQPALDGGSDGLSFYRRIFAGAGPLLAKDADVVLEVGDGRTEAVSELGREAGFVPLGVREDLAGTPRAALFRWAG